jgi:FSR family fosmidomycin resistance protein-like MFS transporter
MQTPTQSTAPPAPFLRDKAYIADALTHFFVDIMNNGRTVLVALLAVSIGLTNAQVGLALLLYNVGSALAQPVFGWLADKRGPRWYVVGGIGWMIAFYAVASFAPEWIALVAVTMAGFGSGAFHPTGTMVASQSSTTKRTQATAFFFMAGQIGLFVGPIAAGLLMDRFGRIGFIALPLFATTALIGGYLHIHNPDKVAQAAEKAARAVKMHLKWSVVAALGWLMLLTNTVSIATINFAPKLFLEEGYSAGYAGVMSGVWMLGSAFGGVVGGWIADRHGNRLAIALGVSGAIIPLLLYIPAPDLARVLLLTIAGFFGGMPHSILVLGAQWLMPGRRAMASGLALGFMFMGGAVGSYAVGIIADSIGLATTLQGLASLLILSLLAVPFMPGRYTVTG